MNRTPLDTNHKALAVPVLAVPALVARTADVLVSKGWMGLIAAACTDLAGSSRWFERGFVSYSNDAKTELLGVDAALIETHGAVSEPVVRAMASGAVLRSRAQVGVAVTGVAGPAGGSPAKPVGTVWFGFSVGGHVTSEMLRFDGDRATVRGATVSHALQRLLQLLA